MGYVLTISLERYQMAKKNKNKTERAEETIVWIPPPPPKKKKQTAL